MLPWWQIVFPETIIHSFIHSSFQQVVGGHVLCTGHYGSGQSSKPDKIPALMNPPSSGRNRQTSKQINIFFQSDKY